jgi:hypothetical protein
LYTWLVSTLRVETSSSDAPRRGWDAERPNVRHHAERSDEKPSACIPYLPKCVLHHSTTSPLHYSNLLILTVCHRYRAFPQGLCILLSGTVQKCIVSIIYHTFLLTRLHESTQYAFAYHRSFAVFTPELRTHSCFGNDIAGRIL